VSARPKERTHSPKAQHNQQLALVAMTSGIKTWGTRSLTLPSQENPRTGPCSTQLQGPRKQAMLQLEITSKTIVTVKVMTVKRVPLQTLDPALISKSRVLKLLSKVRFISSLAQELRDSNIQMEVTRLIHSRLMSGQALTTTLNSLTV